MSVMPKFFHQGPQVIGRDAEGLLDAAALGGYVYLDSRGYTAAEDIEGRQGDGPLWVRPGTHIVILDQRAEVEVDGVNVATNIDLGGVAEGVMVDMVNIPQAASDLAQVRIGRMDGRCVVDLFAEKPGTLDLTVGGKARAVRIIG